MQKSTIAACIGLKGVNDAPVVQVERGYTHCTDENFFNFQNVPFINGEYTMKNLHQNQWIQFKLFCALSLIIFVIVIKDFRADRSASSVFSPEKLLWLHSVWVRGDWGGPGGQQVCGCHQQHGLEVQHHYYWSAGALSCKYSFSKSRKISLNLVSKNMFLPPHWLNIHQRATLLVWIKSRNSSNAKMLVTFSTPQKSQDFVC